MWTVIYLAQSKEIAQKLQKALEDEGLLVKVRPIQKSQDDSGCYEVLVLESEVEQAHSIIIETGF
ncbi:MAG: hypothetical protein GX196_06980 [Clostridiaceae bacterium]|nr:hypothetical protein [Clostridiaceae bacterium]